MVVGEMERKEPEMKVPWIPTTPVKPAVPKPVPICTPGEGNLMGHHANEAVACFEFSTSSEKNGSVSAATVTDIADDNGKTCEQTVSENVSCWGNLSSSEILFPAEAESASSYATQPDNNDVLKNPFIPSIIHDNSRDPQDTLDNTCCTKITSQDTPITPDNAIRAESRQLASMQINMEEKDPGGEDKNVPAKKSDDNGSPYNKGLCDTVMEFTAVSSPFQESHNLDKGSNHDTDLNKTPQQKPKRRKHRPKVVIEGKPKRTRKPVAPKPVQSKENPTGKRKYVRRQGLNKTSTPPTDVMGESSKEMPKSVKMSCRRSLNFDIGASEENSTGRENASALLGKENSVVVQETNVGLSCDLNTSIMQASNSYMPLPGDTQALNKSPSQKTCQAGNPKENPTGKRKYVRKAGLNKTSAPPTEATGELTIEMMPESAKLPCKRSINFDKGAREESSAVKEIGVEVTQEMNANLAYDVNASMKQESNRYMSLREDIQATNTSLSGRNPTRAKPKENPTAKRKYVRRSKLNKSSTPNEVTGELTKEMVPESAKTSFRLSLNFDQGARDEIFVDRENAVVHLGKEIGIVTQEMNVGLTFDLNTSTKQASNNCMSLPNEQAPSTSPSISNPSQAKPKEIPTGKRKHVKRIGSNKSPTPPTEMAGELTEAMRPEYKKMSWGRSLNLDIGARDESSAVRENMSVHVGKENNRVVEEIPVVLAYNPDTWMKQQLNNCMSLTEDTKTASTSSKCKSPGGKPKENPTGKRKYVRRKGLNNTPPLTEMTAELTELTMPQSTIISCRRPLNFDKGARNESNTCRDSLARDQNTMVEESLYNNMPLPENTLSPSISLSKSNPIGAKLNSNSTENKNKRKDPANAQDGNISSVNLIGAQYNEMHSYKKMFCIPYSNITKKKRTGKASNTHIMPSVTTEKVQLEFPQEDAQAHLFALNPSYSWIYSPVYNADILPAISESTENGTETSNDFKLTLRSTMGRSRSPPQTCDFGSITRIGNCDTIPNFAAKQLGISGRQIFEAAKRSQTCIDALVVETGVPLTKKRRNRKRSAPSGSAYFSTNEMQQHNDFALGNHHLTFGKTLGKSLDIAPVAWKTMHNVEALAEQFRWLNINTEARDLPLHKQNALIPFQGSFDPLKKQRPRPKVDIDEETDRVWKLLMLDINSHGIDGTDEDKAKWWEEERNVFRGRANSFIARMHLVQGDRRFTPWKGSVVDSVVGVFLTQNVSDHLSSSAFMSLAARFPLKSSSMCKTFCDEGISLVVNEPQVHVVEPEENTEWDVKLLNQSVHDQSSVTIDILEHSGEKEAVNSNDSCRVTDGVISSTDEPNCRLSESSQRNINEHHSPMRGGLISPVIEDGEEKSSYDGRKEIIDIVSSQCSVVSSQTSGDFSNDQNPEKIGSCSDSNSEVEDLSSTAKYNIHNSSTSFSKLLEMVSSTKFHEVNSQRSKSTENLRDAYGQSIGMKHDKPPESLKKSNVTQGSLEEFIIPSHEFDLKLTHNSGVLEVNCSDPFKTEASSNGFLKNKDENEMNRPSFQTAESADQLAITHSQSIASQVHPQEQGNHMQQSFFNISEQTQDLMQKERGLDLSDHKDAVRSETNEISSAPINLKSRGKGKEKKDDVNWDDLRIKAQAKAGKREKTANTMDSLDWDAVRRADVSEVANTIKERGMNNRLAERIKNFLDRLVEEHGGIDLEWLRDVPPDQAKEYLLSVRGLGLKSVECVRLLTLHHLAFPVDTNVGRIAVRLGWVPLQPLPESLQLHLLELYPILESIQKYLWPRLCKLDQRSLYELHYQMITFGKVFCTKSKPNCNACPMRGECRHFASAFASARLALPGPEQRSIVSTAGISVNDQNPSVIIPQLHLPLPENTNQAEKIQQTVVSRQLESKFEINICQPIIEEPTTPELDCSQVLQNDMEDAFYEDSCEIPTIKLNIEEFTLNLQNYMQENMELQEGEMSKALVALNPEAASIPMPKLKNVSRLRTEHCVYELPDTHPLLEGWDTRAPDDPGKYLLAIWTPGETANSIHPPESKCSSHDEFGQLCNERECFSCNSFREANSQTVRGTILIPCRTAMRGSFPLNGTYFQVNEVFADHESSLNPISVPRSWIWNLNRRTVYFGTSIPTIFKGLSTPEIQQCFWRGYVCVRGFHRETRAPRPLMARLHFPASKLAKTKEKTKKESSSTNSKGTETKLRTPGIDF